MKKLLHSILKNHILVGKKSNIYKRHKNSKSRAFEFNSFKRNEFCFLSTYLSASVAQ